MENSFCCGGYGLDKSTVYNQALLCLATKIKNFLHWLKKEFRDHPPADTRNDADDYARNDANKHGDLPFMWSALKSSSRSHCSCGQSHHLALAARSRTTTPVGCLPNLIQNKVAEAHLAQTELGYFLALPAKPPRKLSGCCAYHVRSKDAKS